MRLYVAINAIFAPDQFKQCNMIHVILVNNELMPDAYTSLAPLFKAYNLSYNNSSRKKAVIWKEGVKYEIKTLTINKVSGRGNKNW